MLLMSEVRTYPHLLHFNKATLLSNNAIFLPPWQFLHAHGIIYNNLKPSAVLVDANGLLKVWRVFNLRKTTSQICEPVPRSARI